ncbi:MAG: glycogen debranching enzyme family protein [Bacteroidales bacterium]|nr:glycogen debranching enzyme family protein [Bacteroidales bacterium]
MAYLKFNKAELVNLEYSLKRELIATNRTGAYANTTIVCCNTRKYHCLLAVPIEEMNWRRHILLSSLDETLIQHEKEFNLGIHCYGKVFEPRGHKYIVDYENDPIPTITYYIGGIKLQKQLLMVENEDRVLIKYTLLDAHSQTTLRLRPLLSFRSIHALTSKNDVADTRGTEIENGMSYKLYQVLPTLYMQLSKQAKFTGEPSWYNGVTYPEEYRRGFDCTEDLFNPGYFEMPIKKGESIIFSASTAACDPASFKRQFTKEVAAIGTLDDFDSTLRHAASRLLFHRQWLEISSGFTWLGVGDLRTTGICAPGIILYNTGNVKDFTAVLDGLADKWNTALMSSCNDVEAPLLFISLIQEFAAFTGRGKAIWDKYGGTVNAILGSYMAGARPEARLHDNGLLWASMPGVALSWMNAYTEGHPVTERGGYQVETNALWYNALRFAANMERKHAKNIDKAARYEDIADKIDRNFYNMFWCEERGHLADYIGPDGQNKFTRPNQLFAVALPYSPISEEAQDLVFRAVRQDLLTTRGIRTLSPKNPLFKGIYDGNQHDRDLAYHNGSTRPWLLQYYAMAGFKLYGSAFLREAREMIKGFEEDMTIHGIGAVAELYDGNPPHYPHGAINSATATGAILTVEYLINKYKEEV